MEHNEQFYHASEPNFSVLLFIISIVFIGLVSQS